MAGDKSMTHWFITEAKAQEIQRDDPMEALRERLPDLYAETTDFLKRPPILRKKKVPANCRIYLVPVVAGGGEAM